MDCFISFSIKADTLGRELWQLTDFFFMVHLAAGFIVLISKYIISLGQLFYNYNNISYSYPLTTCMPQMETHEIY